MADNDDYLTPGFTIPEGEPKVERGRWYPTMPPMLDGETIEQYTDRLTGADGTNRVPYDHHRNRQCRIGWHQECSDPQGVTCKCPCHDPERLVTLWSRWPGEGWVIERSRPLRYWSDVFALGLDRGTNVAGREYRLFEHGVNPNDPKEAR
jgi:hypothetical protein